MAEGSSQTIDRIQVEFSTNISTFVSSLETANQETLKTTGSFTSMEAASRQLTAGATNTAAALTAASTSSRSYTASIASASAGTSTATSSMKKFAGSAADAYSSVMKVTTVAGDYSNAVLTMSESTSAAVGSMNEYTIAANTQADAAREATTEVAKQGTETDRTIQGIKDGFGQIKSVIGLLGVGIGLTPLINQIKTLQSEAEAAGKAFGKMYSTIFYNIGELTDSQKELASSLGKEGFDTTDIAETISRLTALFPDAESTILENGKTALAEMAEEVLWMDRKGYGDVSEIISGMNSAFKKWSVPSDDITGELGYLAATYRDTNTEVSTLMTYLTRLDEVGSTLGISFRDMADFIGAANVAGNIGDLSNAAIGFESAFSTRSSEIYNAIVNSDLETLTSAGISIAKAGSLIDEFIDNMEVDESSAKQKAMEIAETIVTEIFRETNEKAASAATKNEASQIWATALGTDAGRATNKLADLSQASTKGYVDVRTENRDVVTETGQTTTILVKVDKGLGTSDYTAKLDAAKEDALADTWWGRKTPIIEEQAAKYLDEGKDYWNSYALANIDAETANLAATYLTATLNVLASFKNIGQNIGDWFSDLSSLETLLPIGTASAADEVVFDQNLNGLDKTKTETTSDQFDITGFLADVGKKIGDWVNSLSPIGVVSAAEEVVFDQSLNGLKKTQAGDTAEQVDTKDAAEGMEDLGNAAEEASGVLAPFTTDVLVPMNTELAAQGTNLTYNYDATVLLNDTSTNVTVPTVQTETTYVAALAQEYWNLYYAKLAAASV